MKEKSEIVGNLTFTKVCEIIKSKTNCCEVKGGTLICTVTLAKQHHPYNLNIKESKNNFYLNFSYTDDGQEFEGLKAEVVLFFSKFNLPASSINKNKSSIKVEVPSNLVGEVINKLDIFCPDLDETQLIEDSSNDDEDEFFADDVIYT